MAIDENEDKTPKDTNTMTSTCTIHVYINSTDVLNFKLYMTIDLATRSVWKSQQLIDRRETAGDLKFFCGIPNSSFACSKCKCKLNNRDANKTTTIGVH